MSKIDIGIYPLPTFSHQFLLLSLPYLTVNIFDNIIIIITFPIVMSSINSCQIKLAERSIPNKSISVKDTLILAYIFGITND